MHRTESSQVNPKQATANHTPPHNNQEGRDYRAGEQNRTEQSRRRVKRIVPCRTELACREKVSLDCGLTLSNNIASKELYLVQRQRECLGNNIRPPKRLKFPRFVGPCISRSATFLVIIFFFKTAKSSKSEYIQYALKVWKVPLARAV
jgi:hypothetical protein